MKKVKWREIVLLAAIIIFVIITFNNWNHGQENSPIQSKKFTECKVARVIDGDTIVISLEGKQKKLRYLGIDTPELNNSKKLTEYFAKEALEYNKALVENKTLWLEFDVRKSDKYGRLLAYAYLAPRGIAMIDAILVSQGFAQILTIPPNVKYTELFQELQTNAREAERGLWGKSGIEPKVLTPKQVGKNINKYLGKIVTVRYKVIETYDSGKVVFLNSSQDYKTDFTGAIFRHSVKKFKKKDIEPARDYKNKTVEVTGRLKEYNGPEIILTDPSQIKVVELPPQKDDDTIVYTTETGSKYHRKDCRYLRKSAIPIKRSEAKKNGYTPCSICKPDE